MLYLLLGFPLHLFNPCGMMGAGSTDMECGKMGCPLPGELHMMRCPCFCSHHSDKGVLISPGFPHSEKNGAFHSSRLKRFPELSQMLPGSAACIQLLPMNLQNHPIILVPT